MADPSETKPQDAGDAREYSVKDERVAVIVGLKMRLRWHRRSAAKMAAQWGVTEGYVHELATAANKVVRRSATDPDAIAADLLPDLVATYRAASRSVRQRGGDPHAQAKMAASVAGLGTLLADISGLKAPKKTELTGADGGPVQVVGPVIFTPAESDD